MHGLSATASPAKSSRQLALVSVHRGERETTSAMKRGGGSQRGGGGAAQERRTAVQGRCSVGPPQRFGTLRGFGGSWVGAGRGQVATDERDRRRPNASQPATRGSAHRSLSPCVWRAHMVVCVELASIASRRLVQVEVGSPQRRGSGLRVCPPWVTKCVASAGA